MLYFSYQNNRNYCEAIMKMSTKARYGLYACIKLAEKYGDNYHSIIDVANEINVSDGYLEQIIAKLSKFFVIIQ